MKYLLVLLMCLTLCGCLSWRPARYGKCHNCERLYGKRGGDLPGQGSICERCGGHVHWPTHKSDDYYQYKQEFGGTED